MTNLLYLNTILRGKMEEQKSRSGYYKEATVTSQKLTDMLPLVMKKIHSSYKHSPKFLLDAWPEIVGIAFASYTKARRVDNGVLYVEVKTAAVMSLLAHAAEKKKLLNTIHEQYPQLCIHNIIFRQGTF